MPHGDTGCRPPEVLPSPPPSGWSTGFIATPRTCGRLPSHRLRPGLADRHVLVIDVADLADRREALDVDLADLARRHLHRRVVAFLGHQLHRRSGAARDLAALARLQLHVVQQRAERNVLQRQRVARQDVDVLPRRRSCRRPSGRPAAGCSASRRPRRSAARCAPSGSGRTRSSTTFAGMSRLSRLKSMMRYIRLWPPPRHHEVSCAVVVAAARAGAAARPAACAAPVVVISSNICTVWNRVPGDVGLNLRMGMAYAPSRNSGIFCAFAQLHVGLLPVRAPAGEAALPLDLAVRDAGADALDLGAEQLLDRALDLDLVGAGRHLEHDRPAVFAQERRLLGDERPADDVCQFHDVFTLCTCMPSTPAPPAASRARRASPRRGCASITSRAVTPRCSAPADARRCCAPSASSFSSSADVDQHAPCR